MKNRSNSQRQKAISEVKVIVRDLVNGYKPDKVILFGSTARGRMTRSSDIDLLIIKKTARDHWARLREADHYITHDFPVDFLVYTPEEIKERLISGDTFIGDIIKNGKVAYEK